MSIAYWCVLFAAVMPYITVGVARRLGTYDNRNPRSPDNYKGVALLAHGAHQNGFEIFPFFAIAVLVATDAHPHLTLPLLDLLAVAWVVLRIAYTAAYLGDQPSLRSVIWFMGWFVTLAIFTMPVWHWVTDSNHPL